MNQKSKPNYLLIGIIALIIILGTTYALTSPSITGKVTNAEQNIQTQEKNQNEEMQKTQEEPQQIMLIKELLMLKEASDQKKLIDIAKHYNKISEELKKPATINQWNEITDCVYQKCEEQKYISLIDTIASQNLQEQKNQEIHNLIQTYKLWNGKNQDQFSQALETTDTQLNQNEATKQTWQELINCNGCKTMTTKTIQLIQQIVNY